MAANESSNARGRRSLLSLALLLLLLATTAPQHATAYKGLFYPLGERTHLLVHLSLAAELTSRGHEVHMLVPGCHQAFAEGVRATLVEKGEGERGLRWPSYCSSLEDVEDADVEALLSSGGAAAGELGSPGLDVEGYLSRGCVLD